MPKLSFKGKQSEGWKPLPTGTYDIMIDSYEEGTSSKGNPQLKISAHVEGGPFDEKKVTLWYPVTVKSLWKLRNLLDATGVEYEENILDELDPDEGKEMIEITFDPDDLVGCVYTVDAKESEDNTGRLNNNFSGERPVEGSAADKRLQERRAAEEAETEAAETEAEGEEEEEEEVEEAEEAPPKAAPKAAEPTRRRRARSA